LKLPSESVILVPAYFQGVEIETLLTAGYRLRFYRITETFTVDLSDVEKRLDRAVSALYIIHYFGFSSLFPPSKNFCERHGLKLIEDARSHSSAETTKTGSGRKGISAFYSVTKHCPFPTEVFWSQETGRAIDY